MDTRECFAGVDAGSATAKAVLVDQAGGLLAYAILPSGGQMADAAAQALDQALGNAGYKLDEVRAIVATGYGRDVVRGRTQSVTEITCHARGAHALDPAVRSIIDIGGQDSKAIALAPDGTVRKFEMNDKCAAGTGRFIEVMARTLGAELSALGPLALTADQPAKISSTCTVFAESEVISLLARGECLPRIAAGLCAAIAQRVHSLASRVGMTPPVMMTGGVAKNAGVLKHLETALGLPLSVPPEPQIAGAYGAALLARIATERKAKERV